MHVIPSKVELPPFITPSCQWPISHVCLAGLQVDVWSFQAHVFLQSHRLVDLLPLQNSPLRQNFVHSAPGMMVDPSSVTWPWQFHSTSPTGSVENSLLPSFNLRSSMSHPSWRTLIGLKHLIQSYSHHLRLVLFFLRRIKRLKPFLPAFHKCIIVDFAVEPCCGPCSNLTGPCSNLIEMIWNFFWPSIRSDCPYIFQEITSTFRFTSAKPAVFIGFPFWHWLYAFNFGILCGVDSFYWLKIGIIVITTHAEIEKVG